MDTTKLSIIIYLAGCMILYELKLPIMFHEDGSMKKFGLQQNETVFPYWLVITLVGFTSYYLLTCYQGKIIP